MKKISPFFSIISIVLSAAGLCGAVVTVWLTIYNFKTGEALETLSVFILIFGLAWAVASVMAGVSAFGQAKKITELQRNVIQNKLDPRYSRTAQKAYRARLDSKRCRVRAILIVFICLIQMIFTCIAGIKILVLIILAVCGIVVPFLFLVSVKHNS